MELRNSIYEIETIPEKWRLSELIANLKNKGDVRECSNYREII